MAKEKDKWIIVYTSFCVERRVPERCWYVGFASRRDAILAPVARFRSVFLSLLLGSFWVAVGLAFVFARTLTAPIRVLQEGGRVATDEMFRVFNMGVGMIVITAAENAGSVATDLAAAGEMSWILGEVVLGGGVELV